MPDSFGFDHLVNRGQVTRRCIWCPYEPPANASDGELARHARKHRKDALEALEASRREKETIDGTFSVLEP